MSRGIKQAFLCRPKKHHGGVQNGSIIWAEAQIQHGDEAAAVELYNCFVTEIKATTRSSGCMQLDDMQDVCRVLISKAIAQMAKTRSNVIKIQSRCRYINKV